MDSFECLRSCTCTCTWLTESAVFWADWLFFDLTSLIWLSSIQTPNNITTAWELRKTESGSCHWFLTATRKLTNPRRCLSRRTSAKRCWWGFETQAFWLCVSPCQWLGRGYCSSAAMLRVFLIRSPLLWPATVNVNADVNTVDNRYQFCQSIRRGVSQTMFYNQLSTINNRLPTIYHNTGTETIEKHLMCFLSAHRIQSKFYSKILRVIPT
jgi:hypothetical protein